MAHDLGRKYRAQKFTNGCVCPEDDASGLALSRREVLMAGTAAAAAPMVLASLTGEAAAQQAPVPATKVTPELADRIKTAIDGDGPRLVGIFKDIHQNPELGFMEMRTAKIVADELGTLGYEVTTGIGVTGVTGILRNGDGPVVMYRADMDANAVEENSGFDYASKVRVKREDGVEVPVAHMCGHDAHVTWMLGAAKAMVEAKDTWRGTLIFVGQPAEEPIMGVQAMVDDGLYSRHNMPKPDYLLALHTAPVPTGVAGARGGPVMAGTDQIDVTFFGIGGHGSTPQLAKDPVVMAAMAVAEYQIIISRVVPPLETAVLTVGSIQAGTDNNVIPESALLKLNLRFFSEDTRNLMIRGIKSINEGLARTYGMSDDKMPTMVMKGYSPQLVNDDALADRMLPTLKALLGDKAVVSEFPPATGSEDAHLLRGPHTEVPVSFTAVGVADPALFAEAIAQGKQVPFAAHNPEFKVDLNAIPLGAKIGALKILTLMAV
ncbi:MULTISPECIES: amidohydrolase [unclassified Haematobacter]|uniref:amidohydrolase n=1 Tax=unclassified Haematobacter TaxID=2640585 RepID=UPI0025B88F5D|nr:MULTISPECIES: amidohydrolase [unclassified Haematobacter]